MKRLFFIIPFCLSLASCATWFTEPKPGMSTEQVVALRGRPDAIYQQPDNTVLLEWSVGPWAQYAYMAHMTAEGRLIKYEQVLTREHFGRIIIGQATREDVLRTVGHPTEEYYLPLAKKDVWSYRYKEDGIWNSMMHIYFDEQGVVRRMENGMDPMYLRDN